MRWAEARNTGLLRLLCPHEFLALNGRVYKPSAFIHPFENRQSLPGYLDAVVLPVFYDTVDSIVWSNARMADAEFLAFVYMCFLLVHPLVDGNGRVARLLLDYYNARMMFGLEPVWHHTEPKFSRRPFHAAAFKSFFECAELTSSTAEPYPINPIGAEDALRMSQYMVEWLTCGRRGKS